MKRKAENKPPLVALKFRVSETEYEQIKHHQREKSPENLSAMLRQFVMDAVKEDRLYQRESKQDVMQAIHQLGTVLSSCHSSLEECKQIILLGHQHGRVQDEQLELLSGVVETYKAALKENTLAYRRLIAVLI